MLVNIANAQAELGCDVTIVIINDKVDQALQQTISPKVKAYFLKRKDGSRSILPFIKLNWLLFLGGPDVIHCHLDSVIKIIAKPFYKRCFYTRHAVSSQKLPPKERLLKFKKIFAISNAVKSFLWENFQLESIVVENGIVPGNFEKRQYRAVTSSDVIRMVTVGRLLTEVKGQDLIIKAMTYLSKYNICLDIIGDGPDKGALQSLIVERSLSDRVSLLGPRSQNELHNILKDYDIFVMASYTEGFGLTVAEAMAAKLPVVVSNIEGPKEIVAGGKYGHLFKVGDAEDCARAIKYVVANYDTQYSIDEAYRHVQENYSVKTTAANYIKLYQQI